MESALRSFSPLIGAELGGFTIVEELATGGMGTVFLAQRSGPAGFGQPVAIKVIHPHLAQDRGFVEMFVDEARIASCVRHPNVCGVLEFGKARGTFYLAMEYLQGETWATTLRALRQRAHGRDASLLLAHVAAQACEGLHAAHEATDQRGLPLCIVHRDVSPQNLFVGYDGGVRLLDFGIASAADRLHTTRFGTIKGRYSYMAPEQMLGDSVDRRSDIWSLGVLLREGLTGCSVFRGATDAETVYAVTHRLVPPWQVGVHPELRRIADKAMHWEPELRYQSARELGLDLMRFSQSVGAPIGMAELSECMHALFCERIAQRRALLRDAANDNDAGQVPFSLPPPPRLQEEMTTHSVQARRTRAVAEEGDQELPTTRRADAGVTTALREHADHEPELETPTEERLDPAAEAPTWERDQTPTRDHGARRPTTTHELLTVSRPAPPRESGLAGAWMALAALAACVALSVVGTRSIEPTRVVVMGQVRPAASARHAAAARLPAVAVVLAGRAGPASVEPARLPALEFAADVAAQDASPPAVAGRSVETVALEQTSPPRRLLRARARRPLPLRTGASASLRLPAPPVVSSSKGAEQRAVTEAPRVGTLNIITLNGWADVFLGTRKLGTTPGRFELPVGIQTLTLRAAGSGDAQREVVEIRAGEVSRARVLLAP